MNSVCRLGHAAHSSACVQGGPGLVAGLLAAALLTPAGLTAQALPFHTETAISTGFDEEAAGALVATAWWWGLDWLAGAVGLRDWFEAFSHSTLRPNDVPWFHHWFQMTGM